MTTLAWIVIGLFVVGAAIIWIFSILSQVFNAVSVGTNSLLVSLFGRSQSPFAKLTEPPQLDQQPWPDPKNDEVTRRLNDWNPKPIRAFKSSWPAWQSMWITESEGSTTATISEIESLFLNPQPIKPPYEMLDRPPPFDVGNDDYRLEEPPPEPPKVPEEYAAAVLSLPLWKPPLQFLNVYVKTAHASIISKYQQLESWRFDLESTARKLNKARREAWIKAGKRYQKAVPQFRQRHEEYVEQREAARTAFEKARDADLEPLLQTRAYLEKHDPEGVVRHFDLVLRQLVLPLFVPRQWMIHFEKETKTLLVEHRFPEIARLEVTKDAGQTDRFVWNSKLSSPKPVSQKQKKSILPKIQPALCLRIARVMAEADSFGLVAAVAVNGWVDFFDRATGQPKRAYCASLIARKEVLLSLNIETADPVAAFSNLRGANAGETYETAPILPSLRLQTDDPRFIEPRETIAKIAKGENLAAMDWEDFEHLVRELFEREFAANGAEVKITRASRDQGVDAVIFDPDPLRGGRIVIQAKRYTLPVDVSAVRDLYGTVINEGANTGILVTTSHYGPEAYEFAQNKNLKLINGAQLLGLLEKAGYRFRIDLAEARAITAKQ